MTPLDLQAATSSFQTSILLEENQLFSDILQSRFSLKICKIHRKTPVFESLFHKVASLKADNFTKKGAPMQVFSSKYCKIFKKGFFYRTPPVAASVWRCRFKKHFVLKTLRFYGIINFAVANYFLEVSQ